jgi:hypothetical protein
MSRYAPVTSDLLVRKGEAKPWSMPSAADFAPRDLSQAQARRARLRQWDGEPEPVVSAPGTAPTHGGEGVPDERSKRCALRLSPDEYERLGIIAVKKDISRQQVFHQAIEHYLAAAARDYQSGCGCLGGTCRGDC